MAALINIYGEPISKKDILQMRRELDGDIEDSIGFKVFMFTPIPGIDMVAGLATYAVEYGMKAEPRELISDAPNSSHTFDWSVTNATSDYFNKVMTSGRSLINLEVVLLKKHIEIECGTRYALAEVGKIIKSIW